MKTFMISLLSVSALVVASFLAFDFFVDAPVNPVKLSSVSVDAYNIRNDEEFKLCVSDPTQDMQIILVSDDVADCGQSISVLRHDGTRVYGVVDGVLLASSRNKVMLQGIDDNKAFVDLLPYNQATDAVVW